MQRPNNTKLLATFKAYYLYSAWLFFNHGLEHPPRILYSGRSPSIASSTGNMLTVSPQNRFREGSRGWWLVEGPAWDARPRRGSSGRGLDWWFEGVGGRRHRRRCHSSKITKFSPRDYYLLLLEDQRS